MQKSALNEEQPDLSNIKDYFNIVIISDSSVGKTSILEQYINNTFQPEQKSKKLIEIYKKKKYASIQIFTNLNFGTSQNL